MNSIDDIRAEVDKIADNLGMPIDEKIKNLVVALKANGFETTGSCEGHLTRGFPYPWVEIDCNENGLNKAQLKGNKQLQQIIKSLLNRFYINNYSDHPIIIQKMGIWGAFRIQNVRWGKQGATDDVSRDRNLLKEYQIEMNKFADSLLSKK